MKLALRLTLAIAASLPNFSFVGGVAAQSDAESAGPPDELVVTAQRREQSILDVPSSLTSFTEATLEKNMVDDLSGYFSLTPNVNFTEGPSRARRGISIRGVSNIGGNTDSFGFYLDEFNLSSVHINPEIGDIERIEVLRGPQGTYFGRNATGGAINIITKKPDNDFYAELEGDYGRFDTWLARGTVNVPIVEDRLALRGSVLRKESDGFISNVFPGNESRNFTEDTTYKISARLTPIDQLTIDATYIRTEEFENLGSAVGTGVLRDFAVVILGILQGTPTPTAVLDGFGPYPENENKVSYNDPAFIDNEFDIATGRVRFDGDGFSITSISGYIKRENVVFGDVDLSSIDLGIFDRDAQFTIFSQELRIESNSDGPFQWTLGGFYSDAESEATDLSFNGSETLGGLLGPPDALSFAQATESELKSWAAFADASWDVTSRLTLVAGGRYSRDRAKEFSDIFGFSSSDEAKFKDFSPRLSAIYSWTDNINSYVTVSKGYKSGGVQIRPFAFDSTFDKETIWNYEIGVKGDVLDSRLRFGAAAFYMDWKDLQVSSSVTGLIPGVGIVTVGGTDNAAEASSKGAEFEFAALPLEGLELTGTVGYLDAKFDRYPDADIGGVPADLSGQRLPKAPKWTLSATAQYTFPVFNSGYDAFIRAEWNYRSESIPLVRRILEPESFPWRAPAYDVTNIRLGIEGEWFRAVGYVENLFDEQYYTETFDDQSLNGANVRPSVQRYGVRLTFNTN